MGDNEIEFSLLGDNPVDIDKDQLNLRPFVKSFASRLKQSANQTPFTIGIFAPWGQGKTSIMRMLQQRLEKGQSKPETENYKTKNNKAGKITEENDKEQKSKSKTDLKCTTIWFEPWKYNTREGVWKGLCYTIVSKIKSEDSLIKEIRRKRNWLKRFFADFLFSIFFGNTWGQKLLKAIETEPWEPARLHEFETNLNILFEVVNDRITDKEGGPLVLFVDDLDRCLPRPALAVLEALKLVLNKKGLITIMGIAESELDQSIVAAYAKELVMENDRFDDKWGQKYLQKIIQLKFQVPDITVASFESYVKKCLDDSHVADSIGNREEWLSIIREASESNLRQVKRFINRFISELDMADAKNELLDMKRNGARVAFILLIAWRFNDFLTYIRSNSNDKNLFIRYQGYFTGKGNKTKAAWNPKTEIKFKNEEDLKQLFSRCHLIPKTENGKPLVDPFSDWEDFAPYLQFGVFDAGETPEDQEVKGSKEKAGAEENKHKRKKEDSSAEENLSIECNKALNEAQTLISARNLDAASNILKTELQNSRDLSDRFCEAQILMKIAQICQLKNEYSLSIDYINEALNIAKNFKNRQSEIGLLILLSQGFRSIDQFQDAMEQASRANELAAKNDDPLKEIDAIEELGLVYEALNEFERALESFEQMKDISEEIEYPPGTINAYIRKGDVLLKGSDTDAALSSFNKALDLAEKGKNISRKCEILDRLAIIEENKDAFKGATSNREKVYKLRAQLPDRAEEAKALVKLLRNYERTDKKEKATEILKDAIAKSINLDITELLSDELVKFGKEYEDLEEFELAKKYYQIAKKFYLEASAKDKETKHHGEANPETEKLKATEQLADDHAKLGDEYAQRKKFEPAIDQYVRAGKLYIEAENKEKYTQILYKKASLMAKIDKV